MKEAELTYGVIGQAMAVHRELGPGLDEVLYHERLSTKLREAGIEHLFKPRGQLIHRGILADEFEPDIVVPRRVVAELKCLRGSFAPGHLTQMICYLKFWKTDVGLLLDFGKESLIQKRLVWTEANVPNASDLGFETRKLVPNDPMLADLCLRLTQICRIYGLGYRDTTYRGIICADYQADNVGYVAQPVVVIRVGDSVLGEARLDCLVIKQEFALIVRALRQQVCPADKATLQSYLRHLHLPWGAVVNFGTKALHVEFVTISISLQGRGFPTD